MILGSQGARFPKSSRLLKRRDFRFRPFFRISGENFLFIYTPSGSSRLGVSLAKRVMKLATARNRVRRLLKEAFRRNIRDFEGFDVHVVGLPPLKAGWKELTLAQVEHEFASFRKQANRRHRRSPRPGSGEMSPSSSGRRHAGLSV